MRIENRTVLARCCWILLFCLLMCFPVLAAPDPPPSGDSSSAESILEGWVATVHRLYAQAKAAGEEVPESVFEWVKQDLRSAGDWEYKVLVRSNWTTGSSSRFEAVLNRWGAKRWECFWVQPTEKEIVLYFKRQRYSKILDLPFSKMLQILPALRAGSESDE